MRTRSLGKELVKERINTKKGLLRIIDSFPLEYFDSVEIEYMPECQVSERDYNSPTEINNDPKTVIIRFDVKEGDDD